MFYKTLGITSFYSDFNEQKFAVGGGLSENCKDSSSIN